MQFPNSCLMAFESFSLRELQVLPANHELVYADLGFPKILEALSRDCALQVWVLA